MLQRLAIAILLVAIVVAVALHTRRGPRVSPSQDRAETTQAVDPQPGNGQPGLPPRWEPLRTSEPILWGLAARGNRPAAERLFVEAKQCLEARRMHDFLKSHTYESWLAHKQPLMRTMSAAEREQFMEAANARFELGNSYDRLCGNADTLLAHGQFYRYALTAARLGDDDATACVLSGLFDPPTTTPMEAAALDAEAMALGQRALERGHWKTVLALKNVYSLQGFEGQAGPVSHISRADYLKMLYLQSLGTPHGTADSSALAQQIQATEAEVTSAQKFSAERWADETYARYFSRSGPVMNADMSGCDR